MNHYEQRQADRKERLEAAAEKAHAESESRSHRASEAVAGIPFGQPILVDHYSAPRHRAALKRCDQNMRASIEAEKHAEELERRAAAVGSAGISADDPEAIDKLKEKLAEMERQQALLKAVNAAHTKYLKKPESLETSDLPEKYRIVIRSYVPQYSWEPHPVAPYQFSNLSANIRRVRERIAALEAEAGRRAAREAAAPETGGSTETEHATPGGPLTVREDLEENRLLLTFAERQSPDVCRLLQQYGFRWAPTRRAWSRMLTGNARASLKYHLLPALLRAGRE